MGASSQPTRALPNHEHIARRRSSNLAQTAPSASVVPPGTLGEAAHDTDVLPAEVFPGWSPYRQVQMSCSGTGGVNILRRA